MSDLCNKCGACCRVLTVEQSPQEIRSIAALTSVLGIPSDMQFAAQHWHALTRDEAMQRNPFYVSRLPEDAHLYWCDQLGPDGLCMSHETRPLVCRGYPWYGEAPRHMALADPDCGYKQDLKATHAEPASGEPPQVSAAKTA
jgi:Fe-S-cluster containining protein